MYCQNCGNQLREGTKFCPKCGSPVTKSAADQDGANSSLAGDAGNEARVRGGSANLGGMNGGSGLSGKMPNGGSGSGGQTATGNKRKVPIFAIGAIAIVTVVVIFVLKAFQGGSYETPIKNMVEGTEKLDGKQIMKALPDEAIELIEEEMGYSLDEMAEELEDSFSNIMGVDLTEIDFELDYEIEDEFDLSEREIAEIEDELAEEGLELDIKKGKKVELKLTGTVEGEELERDMTLQVIKVGGSWYINPDSM